MRVMVTTLTLLFLTLSNTGKEQRNGWTRKTNKEKESAEGENGKREERRNGVKKKVMRER